VTEAEILYQWHLFDETLTTTLQWWAGISFGLIGLSHFAGKKLNLFLVVVLVVLYISFSFTMGWRIATFGVMQQQLLTDLERVGELSVTSRYLLSGQNQRPLFDVFYLLSVFGTFLGCIGYVIYAYLQGRAARKHN